MSAFLRLIRWPNLLIGAATMIAMRWLVVAPMLANFSVIRYSPLHEANRPLSFSLELQMPDYLFVLLVVSWVFLACAGYIINDYFDVDIDKLNKPGKNSIGDRISKPAALRMYFAFNVVAVLLGFFVSYKAGVWKAGVFYLLLAGLLFYYSSSYKNQPFLGNLIISLIVGLVPIVPAFYEMPFINGVYRPTLENYDFTFDIILYWSIGFGAFAALLNMIRELVKDLGDMEGDSAYGKNTLPVSYGVGFTKAVVVMLIIGTVAGLMLLSMKHFPFQYYAIEEGLGYTPKTILQVWALGILSPMLVFLGLLVSFASTPRQYRIASRLNKSVMLVGLLFSAVAFYMLNRFVIFFW